MDLFKVNYSKFGAKVRVGRLNPSISQGIWANSKAFQAIFEDQLQYMKLLAVLSAFFLLLAGCESGHSNGNDPHPARDTGITSINAFSSLFFDSSAMENYLAGSKAPDTAKTLFRNFYSQRNFQFAWFDSTGIAEQAVNFWNLEENYLANTGDSSIYNPFLQGWIDTLRNNGSFSFPDSLRLKIEWSLTAQFFRYAAKSYYGDRKLDARNLDWFIPRRKVDIGAMLDTLVKDKGKSISSYEPVNRQYGLLREQLARYTAIRHSGAWKPLEPSRKKYTEGDSLTDIIQIKRRLNMTGDMPENDSSAVFNAALTAAVKHFQRRYGLKEDGIIGGTTLLEMNRPIDFRIRQILVNMERIRWVPAEPAGDFLLVNIPAFKLYVYESGKLAFDMNVVVGTSQNNTVIFTGKLKNVVFSPYWNVPPGIMNKEILPAIRRNPSYLERHDMEWNGNQIRQRPGPNNSLGLVKFLFPNSYNIYLHDTPSKNLFNESKRAFSHGCIRVSEPRKLAQWVLAKDPAWTDQAIDKAMHTGKERFVNFSRDITVFVGYFTAWVDREGNLNFRDDLYGHDKKMAEKMFGK